MTYCLRLFTFTGFGFVLTFRLTGLFALVSKDFGFRLF